MTSHTAEYIFVDAAGNTVEVDSPSPCALIYTDENGKFVSIPCEEGYYGMHIFTIPEDVNEVTLLVKGDANQDGEFTNLDITIAKAASLGRNVPFTELGAFAADMSGDGEFSNYDITLMKAALLGRYAYGW